MVVAFVHDLDENCGELWAVNHDGTGERLLVSAADSRSMWVVIPFYQLLQDSIFSVWYIPVDGSPATQFANFVTHLLDYRRNTGVFFSPNLSRIAFEAWDNEAKQPSLHIANVDGSEDVVYASGPEFLGWRSDAQRFDIFLDSQVMVGQVGGDFEPLSTRFPATPAILVAIEEGCELGT